MVCFPPGSSYLHYRLPFCDIQVRRSYSGRIYGRSIMVKYTPHLSEQSGSFFGDWGTKPLAEMRAYIIGLRFSRMRGATCRRLQADGPVALWER